MDTSKPFPPFRYLIGLLSVLVLVMGVLGVSGLYVLNRSLFLLLMNDVLIQTMGFFGFALCMSGIKQLFQYPSPGILKAINEVFSENGRPFLLRDGVFVISAIIPISLMVVFIGEFENDILTIGSAIVLFLLVLLYFRTIHRMRRDDVSP